MNHLSLIFILILLFSCAGLQDKANKKLPEIQAGLNDISHFFDIEKVNPNNFTDLNLMLFESDDYPEYSAKEPFMYYAMDSITLRNSVFIKQDFFSILILDCPFETSVGLFYKQKGKKVSSVIQNKHYPDSITFTQLTDTLLVCQYYWKHDFGSDLSDIRKYYFFGEKTGLFEYGYTCVGSMLKLDDFKIKDKGILLKKNDPALLILPDTLKRLNSSETLKDEIFKPYFTPFNKISLGERL